MPVPEALRRNVVQLHGSAGAEWLARIPELGGDVGGELVAELVASPASRLLLHGDLHQFNILAAGKEWLAIDPKGLIGERECEIGPLILNPPVLLRS